MTSSRAGISSRLVTCFAVVVASAVTGSVAGANPGGEPSQKVLAIGVSLATTKPGASEVSRRRRGDPVERGVPAGSARLGSGRRGL